MAKKLFGRHTVISCRSILIGIWGNKKPLRLCIRNIGTFCTFLECLDSIYKKIQVKIFFRGECAVGCVVSSGMRHDG